MYILRNQAMKTRISKWGNSLAVRIPKLFSDETSLADGSSVEITVRDGSIIITPVSSDYVLDDLVEGITADNRHTETDWGDPQGSEVW